MAGEIETPHLDALARGGLRFTQFYNTGRCCPTRASLLTGLYPHQAGVGHMMDDRKLPGYAGDLNRHCRRLAEVLRPAGYGTYMAGKWHVTKHAGADGPKFNWPLQRGFDRFYGTIHGAGSFYDPSTLTRDNTQISPFADPDYKPDRYYYTDAISDHCIRFIKDHVAATPQRPMFLYAAYTAAHWPMHAFEEDIKHYAGRYAGGYTPARAGRLERSQELGLIDRNWELSPQAENWKKVDDPVWEARGMETYAAMVTRMDAGIGRIVAQLQEAGRLENTLILFLQDNGGCAEPMGRSGRPQHPDIPRPNAPTLPPLPDTALLPPDSVPPQTRDGYPVRMGRHVLPGPADTYIGYGEGWANVSNTPFRLYKHYVHEGGIATPLIAHWPQGIARPGELEHQPGHLIDIMATCIDVAAADYPTDMDGQPITPPEGVSLRPAFQGKSLNRETLYWEHESNRAVRVGNWKLVARGERGAWELYDLDADRTEMHDLAAEQPERVAEMAQRWQTWAARSEVLPLGGWQSRKR